MRGSASPPKLMQHCTIEFSFILIFRALYMREKLEHLDDIQNAISIFLKNHLIFTNTALKNRILDDKTLLTKKAIASLMEKKRHIKNLFI